MQTPLIAVKPFVVLSGLQGNSSQVCDFKKNGKLFNIDLIQSIHTYVFFDVKLIGFGLIFIHPFCSKDMTIPLQLGVNFNDTVLQNYNIYSTFVKNIKVSIYWLVVHQSLQTYHTSSLTEIVFHFITFLTILIQ